MRSSSCTRQTLHMLLTHDLFCVQRPSHSYLWPDLWNILNIRSRIFLRLFSVSFLFGLSSLLLDLFASPSQFSPGRECFVVNRSRKGCQDSRTAGIAADWLSDLVQAISSQKKTKRKRGKCCMKCLEASD